MIFISIILVVGIVVGGISYFGAPGEQIGLAAQPQQPATTEPVATPVVPEVPTTPQEVTVQPTTQIPEETRTGSCVPMNKDELIAFLTQAEDNELIPPESQMFKRYPPGDKALSSESLGRIVFIKSNNKFDASAWSYKNKPTILARGFTVETTFQSPSDMEVKFGHDNVGNSFGLIEVKDQYIVQFFPFSGQEEIKMTILPFFTKLLQKCSS